MVLKSLIGKSVKKTVPQLDNEGFHLGINVTNDLPVNAFMMWWLIHRIHRIFVSFPGSRNSSLNHEGQIGSSFWRCSLNSFEQTVVPNFFISVPASDITHHHQSRVILMSRYLHQSSKWPPSIQYPIGDLLSPSVSFRFHWLISIRASSQVLLS